MVIEEKKLYFNTQICVYHNLFIDRTADYVQGLIQAAFDVNIPILDTQIWVCSNLISNQHHNVNIITRK